LIIRKFMMTIYNEILYRPLFNIMVYLQNVIPGGDLGITIIILTIVIRVLFMPLSLKTINSQKMLKELTPKIEELKTKFKNDKTAQSAAIMRLYKENNVNPLAGCLPLLVQIPILIALYRVFIGGITEKSLIFLYGFIAVPEVINHNFLGLFDITKNSPLLTIIAGGLQFIQSKQSTALQAGGGSNKELASISKQMLYFFPVMIIVIGWNLPAGLILYWITTTVFSVFEQYSIRNKK